MADSSSVDPAAVQRHLSQVDLLISKLGEREGASPATARKAIMKVLEGYAIHGCSIYEEDAFIERCSTVVRGIENLARSMGSDRPSVPEPWRPPRLLDGAVASE